MSVVKMNVYGWGGLIVTLCLATFGLQGFLFIIALFIIFALSVFTSLFVISQKWTDDYWNKASISRLVMPDNGIPCVKKCLFNSSPNPKCDKRLTGSSVIDEHLQEVLQLTLRDYVLNWYRKITDDEKFPLSLQESAQQIVVSLANRVKEIDWVSFCTIQLVDDFASHFRLFRQALHQLNKKKKTDSKTTATIEQVFFELEKESSAENVKCWSEICMSNQREKDYLQGLVEILLYLLLPDEDFNNKTLRYLARDLMANVIFIPTINLFSDPDYINQTIVWLCRDVGGGSDSFMTVLRLTNSVEELQAVEEKVNHEIAVQRSKDSGGEDDAAIKQQLNSLLFVKRVIDHRLQRLQEGVDTDSSGLPARFDWKRVLSSGYKLCSLPLDVILKHNVALSYFIDFMICTGHQCYMFFYLTVEGYRVSAEQQISQYHLEKSINCDVSMEVKLSGLREAAMNIYEQYLSVKATPRIKLDENLTKKLLQRIQTEVPSETWFDESQNKVLEILSDDKYFGAFTKSPQYIKMLAELDLLKDASKSEDDDVQSWEEVQSGVNSFGSDTFSNCSSENLSDSTPPNALSAIIAKTSSGSTKSDDLVDDDLLVKAKIVGTGLIREAVKPYVVYAVEVIKKLNGKDEKWQVYRRYSDFYDLHMTVLDKVISKFCN
ncbi:sorting nexin 13 [Chamberlinius hualienensis]